MMNMARVQATRISGFKEDTAGMYCRITRDAAIAMAPPAALPAPTSRKASRAIIHMRSNEVASGGADPCYVTLDKTGKYVLVANYTGGNVSVFPLRDDGRLDAEPDRAGDAPADGPSLRAMPPNPPTFRDPSAAFSG